MYIEKFLESKILKVSQGRIQDFAKIGRFIIQKNLLKTIYDNSKILIEIYH